MWGEILKVKIFSLASENIQHIEYVCQQLSATNRGKFNNIIQKNHLPINKGPLQALSGFVELAVQPIRVEPKVEILLRTCKRCKNVVNSILHAGGPDAYCLYHLYGPHGVCQNMYDAFINSLATAYKVASEHGFDPGICTDWQDHIEYMRYKLEN